MDDIRAGRVECICVKDLSRFSRNYIETIEFLEKIFPFMGVRFVSVNDGYDNNAPGSHSEGLLIALKSLVNDQYLRDISRKICSTVKSRRERGEYTGSQAPFGYKKVDDCKSRLEPDPETAPVLRQIFEWRAAGVGRVEIGRRLDALGMGSTEITRTLNAENVPTPMMHKLNVGTSQQFLTCINEDNFWMQSTVVRILRDERYTGKNIYGKHTRDIIGNSHTIQTSRSSWVVVNESHDAIIAQEDYEKAQHSLRKFHEQHCTPKSNHPLRGKLVCGVCGHIMCRSNGKEAYYYCKTSKHTDAYPCHDCVLPEAEIKDVVLTAIRTLCRPATSGKR